MKGIASSVFTDHVFFIFQIRGVDSTLCVDSMGHKNGDGPLEVGHCHRMGGNQLFRLSEANQLAQYDQCVALLRGKITVDHCDVEDYRIWNHDDVSVTSPFRDVIILM